MLWLQAHRTYPPAAQRRGDQGSALVRLTISRDGHVRDCILLRSTGSDLLDEAVHDLLVHADLPPFPPTMPRAQAVIEVPIHYRLQS